jgi:hypothetical protein
MPRRSKRPSSTSEPELGQVERSTAQPCLGSYSGLNDSRVAGNDEAEYAIWKTYKEAKVLGMNPKSTVKILIR